MSKWIIDTDYSSNSQKVIEVLLKNKVDIIAITLVKGLNKLSPSEIKNLIELDLKNKFNLIIPVYVGASEPFIDYSEELGDSKIENPYELYNESNRKSKDFNNISENIEIEEVAAVKIVELIKQYGKNLNILTLSSLTNLSLAILLENTLSEMFNQLVVVGGSSTGKGNSGVFSEANFRADPVAAKNVISYYKNIVLITLEVEYNFMKENWNIDFLPNDFGDLKDYAIEVIKNGKSILQLLSIPYIIDNRIY
jgi:inosine-uridine nucleoside N-ribohydrolase